MTFISRGECMIPSDPPTMMTFTVVLDWWCAAPITYHSFLIPSITSNICMTPLSSLVTNFKSIKVIVKNTIHNIPGPLCVDCLHQSLYQILKVKNKEWFRSKIHKIWHPKHATICISQGTLCEGSALLQPWSNYIITISCLTLQWFYYIQITQSYDYTNDRKP